MISIKKERDLEKMRRSGQVVADVLKMIRDRVAPGVNTLQLDRDAEDLIRKAGGAPAFKGYRIPGVPTAFPGTICASLNEEVVHGIPSADRVLQEGDLLSVDVGVLLDGFYGDAAMSYPVGEVTPLRRRLLEVTHRSLNNAVAMLKDGVTVGDIGYTVESTVLPEGFGLVRNYAGHGIGRRLHEPPQVPNFGRRGSGVTLKNNMTIAIEPMVMAGEEEVKTLADMWTVVTADGSEAAHFEKSVVIGSGGAEVLTPWEE
ncbi:MAG: type I methionyl aminopeptidase [Synergistales bacterium]|nr:type I methionyl aminopeptidase [Synergistales bacterium]